MMSGSFRLPGGGRIDRARELRFTLDGKAMSGLQGDSLASALLANGITLIGRSFKYHRPRGFLSAGAEEPNGLMTLGDGDRTEPNVPATVTELRDALAARRQNAWPSVRLDLRAINSWAAPLPSGVSERSRSLRDSPCIFGSRCHRRWTGRARGGSRGGVCGCARNAHRAGLAPRGQSVVGERR